MVLFKGVPRRVSGLVRSGILKGVDDIVEPVGEFRLRSFAFYARSSNLDTCSTDVLSLLLTFELEAVCRRDGSVRGVLKADENPTKYEYS